MKNIVWTIAIASSLLLTPSFADEEENTSARSWKIFLKSGQMIEFQAIWNGTDAGSKFTADYAAFLKDGTKPSLPIMYNFRMKTANGKQAARVQIDWDRVEAVVQVF